MNTQLVPFCISSCDLRFWCVAQTAAEKEGEEEGVGDADDFILRDETCRRQIVDGLDVRNRYVLDQSYAFSIF